MLFVFYLGNNRYKALKIARNKDKILEAKKAIDELEAVRLQLLDTSNLTKHPKTNLIVNKTPSQTQVRQSTRVSITSSIDLTAEDEEETDKLPDIEPAKKGGKKTKIPAPVPPKTAGFTPSSARRGRG